MTDTDTRALIDRARRTGVEATDLEVKSAVGGLPKSVLETLSAFAIGNGGTILLGINEADNFAFAPGFDANAIREAIAQAAAEKMTPPLRMPIEIEEFEGERIVRLDVVALDPADRPCFVTDRGEYNGSFIRGGEGDRRLTRYEVTQLLANRTQPTDDRTVVTTASMSDLDPKGVARLLSRVRENQPRAFADLDDDACLMRLNVAAEHEGTLKPTLAGLLSLGLFPQQHFPQLSISVVALPSVEMGVVSADGERFLDNVTCEGSIPDIVDQAVRAVRRNITRSATISGSGRTDREEYPPEVIRELIANAVMHRDYSPESYGSQVQVELYPDRLVVRNPGGFWGSVVPERLGEPHLSSSRNAALARLLTDVTMPNSQETVCENRGSGIPTVMLALKRAGLQPARFRVQPGLTEVSVPRHALLTDDTLQWLAALKQDGLTDAQAMALATMRADGSVSNATLQGWGLHSSDATRELADLVTRGLAFRLGGKRYATYELTEFAHAAGEGASSDHARELDEVVFDFISEAGDVSTSEVREAFDLSYPVALRTINRLIASERVAPTAGPTSRRRRYKATRS